MGKAIAAHLAEEGAKVVILGRKAEVGNAIVNEIKAKGGEAMFLVTNVLDEAILEQNLKDILAAYGRVDALLNAAGGNMPGATIAPTGNFFDGGTEERGYCELLFYGGIPSDDSCMWLCGCKSGNL